MSNDIQSDCWLCDSERLPSDSGQQGIKGDNDVSLTADSGQQDIKDDADASLPGIKDDSEQLLQCDVVISSSVSLSAVADTSCSSNAEQHDVSCTTTTTQQRQHR